MQILLQSLKKQISFETLNTDSKVAVSSSSLVCFPSNWTSPGGPNDDHGIGTYSDSKEWL